MMALNNLEKSYQERRNPIVGNNFDSIVEKALLQAGVWVLDALLENVALLLVDARDHFCSVCSFLSTRSESPIMTANWLLIGLHHLLYPHLKTDRHLSRKQGTILLRNGGDPSVALHATLASYRSKCLRLEKEL